MLFEAISKYRDQGLRGQLATLGLRVTVVRIDEASHRVRFDSNYEDSFELDATAEQLTLLDGEHESALVQYDDSRSIVCGQLLEVRQVENCSFETSIQKWRSWAAEVASGYSCAEEFDAARQGEPWPSSR